MTRPDDTIRVLIPLKVRKKNGRPKIMPPADYRPSEDQIQDPHILRAIGRAQREVLIANAYFVPGRRLRLALERAARRGVRVTLLLQGRYEYFMQYYASRPVYASLLRAGVAIHEYSPSFLHAKVAVIDGRWATVGSSNLDPFSLLLAREANVVVRDAAFAQSLQDSLHHAIQTGATKVEANSFAQRGRWQQLVDWAASLVLRFGVFLTGKRY